MIVKSNNIVFKLNESESKAVNTVLELLEEMKSMCPSVDNVTVLNEGNNDMTFVLIEIANHLDTLCLN